MHAGYMVAIVLLSNKTFALCMCGPRDTSEIFFISVNTIYTNYVL